VIPTMSATVMQPKFDRLAAAIAGVRETCDGGSASVDGEAQLQRSLSELEAALQATREGNYWPSQRDAIAALALAADLVRAGQEAENDPEAAELEALIRVGLERLKRMGL
jgi:hypothetical protein